MKKKSSFSGSLGFVLAAAGSAVGVGNIWRFPYLAAKDGGGLFLIVYLLLVFTFGFTLLTTDVASVSMGIMITYGSYVKKDVNLSRSLGQIEFFDTVVAFLAGLMIIPAVYVFFGTEGMASGPSLMFISLPKVFESMGPLGAVIGLVFFLMVVFAALTSNVSIMETLVANCMELYHTSRKKTALAIGLVSAAAATVICLGYNVLYFKVDLPTGAHAQQLLDVVDYISNSFLMPLISLLTCILVGWIVKPKWIVDEMESSGHPFPRKALYTFMICYATPVMMAVLFLESIGLLSCLRRLLLG